MGMPVTIKGQVTIPKPIRERLGITPGASAVEFEVQANGQVVLRRAAAEEDYAQRIAAAGGMAEALEGFSTDEVMRLLRGDDDDAA
jgi:antitoxin PrlF